MVFGKGSGSESNVLNLHVDQLNVSVSRKLVERFVAPCEGVDTEKLVIAANSCDLCDLDAISFDEVTKIMGLMIPLLEPCLRGSC